MEDADEGATSKRGAKKKGQQAGASEIKMRKLLVNMEQWRWMPEDLGQFYVWANVPEFTLRVMKDGKAVHTERLVVGKADLCLDPGDSVVVLGLPGEGQRSARFVLGIAKQRAHTRCRRAA